MNIETRLGDWLRAGLITQQQANAIASYESERAGAGHVVKAQEPPSRSAPRAQRNWALYGIVGIGVTAMATGFISLIASNWDAIPVAVKFLVFFAVQSGLGWGVWTHRARPGVVREALLTLFGVLFLAGIGLAGQVYNLHSDGWQGLSFWLLLMLPVTLLAQSRLINHVWLIGFATAAGIWLSTRGGHEERSGMLLVLALFLFAALGLWARPRPQLPRYFAEAARFWSLLLIVGGGTHLASVLWYTAERIGGAHKALPNLYLVWVGLLATLLSLFAGYRHVSAKYLGAMSGLLTGVVIFFTLPLYHPVGEQRLASAIIYVLLWSLAGLAAVAQRKRRLFDAISVIIALRFIVAYFEIFGSLAATGIGLILSGGVILGVAYAWHRYRSSLARWLEAA